MTKDNIPGHSRSDAAATKKTTETTPDASGQTWPQVCRRKHNADLIRRMRNGEALWSFDSSASWFPERRKIEKDPKALKRLYGEDFDKDLRGEAPAPAVTPRAVPREGADNVVALRPDAASDKAVS